MSGYTKLFPSILSSTVWQTPYPTRIVWVTLLAMADRDGVIEASTPGLAKMGGVTLEECEAALACFLSPDRYSKTPDHDGRRIETVENGWRLLNAEKYREKQSAEERREKDAERQQRKRDRAAARDASRGSHAPSRPNRDASRSVTPRHAESAESRHAEASADAEATAEGVPAGPAKVRSLIRGEVVDGQPLSDWLRSGVAKGYESLRLPAPTETNIITWAGWRTLETWVVEKDRLTGKGDQRETGRHLIRCFLRSPRAAKLGHPITFLVANANEYWRDTLPPALEAAS